jgi:hypothetical protein
MEHFTEPQVYDNLQKMQRRTGAAKCNAQRSSVTWRKRRRPGKHEKRYYTIMGFAASFPNRLENLKESYRVALADAL